MKFIYVLFWSFLFSAPLVGQEKCALIHNHSSSQEKFEGWMKQELKRKASVQNANKRAFPETVYNIPVVVHVIHQGEPLGTRSNILDAQILSQIETLNEDFRRLNDDRTQTPSVFEAVAADVKINFSLAKRDPEGLPTSGIIRTKGSLTQYGEESVQALSRASYWPAEEYFNIWVTTIASPYIGFAFFPFTNLEGIRDQDKNINRLIDGAVIDYAYFGTGHNARDFSKGRTLTHEIGHWLGLRHIWGDTATCSVDDFCDDTPFQSRSYNGECPEGAQNSCSNDEFDDMYQNFMDYTDDQCMNLFTVDQTSRMRLVLEQSPRRKSLLSSAGNDEPIQVANDLGIRAINTPLVGNCTSTFIPEIEVRNYGTNEIQSFVIQLYNEDQLLGEYLFEESLDLLEVLQVQFSEMTQIETYGDITFKISEVNEGIDGNQENDCRWVSARFMVHQETPFFEVFDLVDWEKKGWISEADGAHESDWSVTEAANEDLTNTGAILKCFNSPLTEFGKISHLYSPVFSIEDFPNIDLSFDYAYSGTNGDFSEALTVVYSTDCGVTFPSENVVFERIGTQLLTTATQETEFIPEGREVWRTFSTTLSQDILDSDLVIAFIGYNGNGNNIFVDNVSIEPLAIHDDDIGLTAMTNMPLVSCEQNMSPKVVVRNFGKNLLNDFNLTYKVNDRSNELSFSNMNLESGASLAVPLGEIGLEIDDNWIDVQVSSRGDSLDENNSNDAIRSYFKVDTLTVLPPFRERFDQSLEQSKWVTTRNDSLSNWQSYTALDEDGSEEVVLLPSFDLLERGTSNWLISPMLDLSKLDASSFFFDVSYANRSGRNDQLNVWGSVDCGNTFDYLLYSKKGADLAVLQQEIAWEPSLTSHWKKEYVSLTNVNGFPNVRIGLEVVNENGNNIYLDNFEFFVADEEEKVWIENTMSLYPNPAVDFVDVTFNFNIQEAVSIRLFSINGNKVYEQTYERTLNQTYRLSNLSLENGLYILHVGGQYTDLTGKVFVKR